MHFILHIHDGKIKQLNKTREKMEKYCVNNKILYINFFNYINA